MVKVLVLLLGLYGQSLFALESSDVLDTRILKVYDKNILVLNRGLEDAIFTKDHIKLTSSNGFIARGICIKTSMMTSHWKIYRVTRPQLVSKDTLYKLRSINQSEMPRVVKEFSEVDFSQYFNDYGDKDLKKELKLQEKRIAKYDLPTDIEKTNAFKQPKKSKFEKFLTKAFDPDQIDKDLEKTYINIFASPLSWQTRYNQKENHYGISIYNIGKKYTYELNAIEAQKEVLDPVTAEGYSAKSSFYEGRVNINKLNSFISIFSEASQNREKIGKTYYPYIHQQIGLLGITLHLWEGKPKDEYLNFSYIPVFDNFSYSNPDTSGESILDREGIRHIVRIKYRNRIFENLHHDIDILYSKYNMVEEQDIEVEDTHTKVANTFSYHLGNNFYGDYKFEYEKDELRAELYDISTDNLIQSLRFRYEFSL